MNKNTENNNKQIQEKIKHLLEADKKGLLFELPCPLGTPVYVIESCTCNISYKDRCMLNSLKKSKRRSDIMRIQLPQKKINSYTVNCRKLYVRPFLLKHLSLYDKSVFLDKEKAEEVLMTNKNKTY